MAGFQFSTTASLISGPGSITQLADVCARLGIRRPLVVCDRGVMAAGLLDTVDASLAEASLRYTLYSDVVADPPESVIQSCLDTAAEAGIDGVIGFGGGSSLDTAKLVALLARSGEALADIYGVDQCKGPRLPLIQIPTTAGTGSEVTPVAIVTTGKSTKSGVVSALLLPDVALLDGALTTSLPPFVTASTGIDAMVHAIEAYTSAIKKNPYSDMLAEHALRLMSTHLRQAFGDGSDLEARQNMLLGACLAGQAFANAPVAAVHALAYPLGGHYHIPHGLSNSLVLPHVLRFNAEHASHLYARLFDIVCPDAAATPADDRDKTTAFIAYLEQLIQDLDLPSTLDAMDVPQSDLAMLASDAMLQTRLLVNNPRPLSEAEALAIYQAAF